MYREKKTHLTIIIPLIAIVLWTLGYILLTLNIPEETDIEPPPYAAEESATYSTLPVPGETPDAPGG